jgi:hypothetical protein
MKRIANYIGFLIVITTFFSCNNSSTSETPTEEVKTEMPAEKVETEPIKTNNVVESSNEIGQITIGNQIWSTKNLDVSNFRNGDIIPEAKTDEEWAKFGQEHQPAWCYYDNDPENGKMYGKLYNWYAVNQPLYFISIFLRFNYASHTKPLNLRPASPVFSAFLLTKQLLWKQSFRFKSIVMYFCKKPIWLLRFIFPNKKVFIKAKYAMCTTSTTNISS